MNKKLSIKKIIGSIITALCITLCFYVAIEVIVATNQGRPPRVLGVSISYVPTASMEPEIHVGDYVLFTQVDYADVNVGDVVVYKNNDGRFIIHKVIEKYDEYLITKGVNNQIPDDIHVTSDILYGRYVKTLGFMKIFGGGISKNLMFILVMVIFILMIAVQAVQLAVKAKTEKINKEAEENKKILLEQMKNEILAEELEKIRKEKENK